MRIEEDRKIDNRFIATMIIDRLEEDDFEEENHILRSRSFSFLPAFRRSGFQALWHFAQIIPCLSYYPAGIMVISMRSTKVKQFLLKIVKLVFC